MRPDHVTNTEAQAAAYEHSRALDAGRDEPYGFVETRTPFCRACQNGTKDHLCGPCTRELERSQTDEH